MGRTRGHTGTDHHHCECYGDDYYDDDYDNDNDNYKFKNTKTKSDL